MTTFATRRRVPFTPGQMYALVADVERYPEFVPLCERLVVHDRTPTPAGDVLTATMAVGYKAISEQFRCRVTLEPAIPRVSVQHLEGPFRHLENRWLFHSLEDGRACEIDFHIAYEFRSFMLQALMGGLFQQAFEQFAQAFETRARAVYGMERRTGV